jgi:hypothetical protein
VIEKQSKPSLQKAAGVEDDVPFKPSQPPEGWKLDGVFPGMVQFARPDMDFSAAFVFFSSAMASPTSIIRRAAGDMANKNGVEVMDMDVAADGNEATLQFEDSRIGVKRGKLVARCFPGRTIYCVLTAGLWPKELEKQGLAEYEVFLSWVRPD